MRKFTRVGLTNFAHYRNLHDFTIRNDRIILDRGELRCIILLFPLWICYISPRKFYNKFYCDIVRGKTDEEREERRGDCRSNAREETFSGGDFSIVHPV